VVDGVKSYRAECRVQTPEARRARVLSIVADHCAGYRPEIGQHAAKRAAWCAGECPEFGALRCGREKGCEADRQWIARLVAGVCEQWPAELAIAAANFGAG